MLKNPNQIPFVVLVIIEVYGDGLCISFLEGEDQFVLFHPFQAARCDGTPEVALFSVEDPFFIYNDGVGVFSPFPDGQSYIDHGNDKREVKVVGYLVFSSPDVPGVEDQGYERQKGPQREGQQIFHGVFDDQLLHSVFVFANFNNFLLKNNTNDKGC